MSTDPELEAMAAIAKALEGLEVDAQVRVLKWISEKKGLPLFKAVSAAGAGGELESGSDGSGSADGEASFNRKTTTWMKQNSVTASQLDQVFFFSGEEAEIIAPEVPGRSTKERAINAYLLMGVIALVRTGTPDFADQAGRDACKGLGCLDSTNHSKYMAEKGNLLAGGKDRGWTATPQGLKQAALIIKDIAGDA